VRYRPKLDNRIAQDFTTQVLAGLERVGATGGRLVVAVSGGPDSTALLVALDMLRHRHKFDVVAAHINHMLRGEESERDEHFTRELCERLNAHFVCHRVPVPIDASDRQESIEATARDRRLQSLAQVASEQNASFVATAHTANDQGETVLHRIVRGTGLAGLAGIPQARLLGPGITLIRPMLHVHRQDVRTFLDAIGQDFREDSSNRDLQFTRNRLRHEVLPYLASHVNPQIISALVRLASLASDAQAVVDGHVDRLMRRARIQRDPHRVVWNVNVLRRAPRYILCEAFRRLWAEQSWPQQDLGQSDLTRLADLVQTAKELDGCHLPGGIVARRHGKRLIASQDRTESSVQGSGLRVGG
jgi:tRNA(Ile)-lysidine synthase